MFFKEKKEKMSLQPNTTPIQTISQTSHMLAYSTTIVIAVLMIFCTQFAVAESYYGLTYAKTKTEKYIDTTGEAEESTDVVTLTIGKRFFNVEIEANYTDYNEFALSLAEGDTLDDKKSLEEINTKFSGIVYGASLAYRLPLGRSLTLIPRIGTSRNDFSLTRIASDNSDSGLPKEDVAATDYAELGIEYAITPNTYTEIYYKEDSRNQSDFDIEVGYNINRNIHAGLFYSNETNTAYRGIGVGFQLFNYVHANLYYLQDDEEEETVFTSLRYGFSSYVPSAIR